jgi:hypothetical protein
MIVQFVSVVGEERLGPAFTAALDSLDSCPESLSGNCRWKMLVASQISPDISSHPSNHNGRCNPCREQPDPSELFPGELIPDTTRRLG